VTRNERHPLDRPLTDERLATTYNNFYEFGSHKQIRQAAQSLPLRPWTVTLDGMVEREQVLDIDDLLARMPLEKRLYRHRCVEAWSMAVPWSGFALAALVDLAAGYVRMESFLNPETAPGQRQFWYPRPYVDGLSIVPRKYGFKSIKSLVGLTFTDQRPVGFWEEIQSSEYGFWAPRCRIPAGARRRRHRSAAPRRCLLNCSTTMRSSSPDFMREWRTSRYFV
jgi:sulfoxide reductase catalytic subunit YedY